MCSVRHGTIVVKVVQTMFNTLNKVTSRWQLHTHIDRSLLLSFVTLTAVLFCGITVLLKRGRMF